MVAGVSAAFWLSALWKYSASVSKTQKQLQKFTTIHMEQNEKIKHAVKEHTRLAQQQPMVEPILKVMAKGYRVQLQSDVSIRAQVTTKFDPAVLPACVTLGRAIDTDEVKMMRLRRRALSVLTSRGWRTNGLNQIARIHADSRMLDSNSLSLKSLDTDSVVSATSAQKLLTEAFSNTTIHERVSRERLVKAIRDLHAQVLANFDSDDRLEDEDPSENWISFLSEILSDETAPFGVFNILDRNSELNRSESISSVGVVPHYFTHPSTKVEIRKSASMDVMPLDVVVRVDVSQWAEPSAFAVFGDNFAENSESESKVDSFAEEKPRRITDV
jgi:hypothetical protein